MAVAAAPMRNATGFKRWIRQCRALTYKNFMLTWRLRRSTALEVAAPFLIMCLIGVLDVSLRAGLPDSKPGNFSFVSSEVFPCRVFDNEDGKFGYGDVIPGAWCVPMVYAPSGSSDVDDIMKLVATRNGYDPPVASDGNISDTRAPQQCGARKHTRAASTRARPARATNLRTRERESPPLCSCSCGRHPLLHRSHVGTRVGRGGHRACACASRWRQWFQPSLRVRVHQEMPAWLCKCRRDEGVAQGQRRARWDRHRFW